MEPPSGDLSNGTNSLLEAAFCEPKLCSGNQHQAQCVFAQENKACLVLTWPYAPHRAKEGLGCLWPRGRCCLAVGIHSQKPTPNVFSFGEKADLGRKCFDCPGPSNPPFPSSGGTQLGLISDTAHSRLREAEFCESNLCSGNQPQPLCFFAQESQACLVLT